MRKETTVLWTKYLCTSQAKSTLVRLIEYNIIICYLICQQPPGTASIPPPERSYYESKTRWHKRVNNNNQVNGITLMISSTLIWWTVKRLDDDTTQCVRVHRYSLPVAQINFACSVLSELGGENQGLRPGLRTPQCFFISFLRVVFTQWGLDHSVYHSIPFETTVDSEMCEDSPAFSCRSHRRGSQSCHRQRPRGTCRGAVKWRCPSPAGCGQSGWGWCWRWSYQYWATEAIINSCVANWAKKQVTIDYMYV